jgi:hypothetical protein
MRQKSCVVQASLLQALHRTVKDASLPLPAGALWAQHVLPARRAEWTLNVRASSHKKFSKLLQAHAYAAKRCSEEPRPLCPFNIEHSTYGSWRSRRTVSEREAFPI